MQKWSQTDAAREWRRDWKRKRRVAEREARALLPPPPSNTPRERMSFRTLNPHDGRRDADPNNRRPFTLDRMITVTLARVSLGCETPGERMIDWRSA